MTASQVNLAHALVSELNIYAKAAEQYGHGGMVAAMRNAASLLQTMVDEYEAAEQAERADV
jgi:hypothetical protein